MSRSSKRWWQYRDEWWLVVAVLGLLFAFWPVADSPSAASHQQGQRVVGADSAIELVSKSTPKNLPANVGTMPIEAIEVGQRVLGRDPLIDDAERAQWTEPDWQHWLKLSLVMRKETGDELQIEMLRPEAWLMERWQFVADRPLGWCVVSASRDNDKVSDDQLSLLLAQCGPPWRTYRQQIAATTIELAAEGYELVGLTLALDLHEIGAAGEAIVTDIQPAPTVVPGNGRVVTGTFSHRSGDVIDLVLSDRSQENERIGTTSNHPFWSEDRRDYVQAGSLEEGERVLTYAGDTKRVVSKLARPGPRPVYNLEVHGEHVYHVGNDGVLVHNQNGYTGADAPKQTVLDNAVDGAARERRVHDKLTGHFKDASVQRERMLRTADGKKAIDPLTGEGRRIDHAVIQSGEARYLVETTSKTADKAAQLAKEARIRANGGTFIRDKVTRELIDISNVPTRVTRRK